MENLKYNKIKVALAERDLSNKWLANKLGKTEMTVSRWVSNKCIIRKTKCSGISEQNVPFLKRNVPLNSFFY